MSDETGSTDDGAWLVEPSGYEIQVAIGSEAHLTPAVREALDELMRLLEGSEVEAFETAGKGCPAQCKAPGYGSCNPQAGGCSPKFWMPCAKDMTCNIVVS